MKSKVRSQKWGIKTRVIFSYEFQKPKHDLNDSCRNLRSHELCYCFLSLSLSRSLIFHILCSFIPSSGRKCQASRCFSVSSSCREACVSAARTSRSSPSQPSTHAPTLGRGLFLSRDKCNLINKLYNSLCFALE